MENSKKYYSKAVRLSESEYETVQNISKHVGGMVSFSDIVRASIALYWKYLLMGGDGNAKKTTD